MPIPLAHPAAILPLRRYCDRWLSFPALVIGSLAPDLGYLFNDPGLGGLSHQIFGCIAFGLPAGALAMAALYGFRKQVVALLPEAHRRIYEPLCRRPMAPLWVVGLSLIIGIWSHIFWDSFVHNDGWMVQQSSLLQIPIVRAYDRTARVTHLLWYGSSIVGVMIVLLSFERWRVRSSSIFRDAIIAAVLIVPIALIHHIFNDLVGISLTAGLCGVLMYKFLFSR